jgi:hypothetical protein
MASQPVTWITPAVNSRSVVLARKDANSAWVQLENCDTDEAVEEYIRSHGLDEDTRNGPR